MALPAAVPAGLRHTTIFNDVHSALHNITSDLAHFRQLALDNDQARADEIEALRNKLQQERYEHREQINKFRYELDDLVHQKIEKLIDLIEMIHRNEKKDDREQREHIGRLRVELRKVKDSLKMVTGKWETFLQRATEERQPAKEVTAEIANKKKLFSDTDVTEKPATAPKKADGS